MIWRYGYRALLCLHPEPFRRKYAREMLWVFDQEVKTNKPYRLLWDAAGSLVRQRLRDSSPPRCAAADRAPAFHVLEGDSLGVARIASGVLVAGAAFGIVLTAVINHGAYPGALMIPTIYTYVEHPPPSYDLDFARLSALDRNRDGWIDSVERAAADARRWEPLLQRAPIDDLDRVAIRDLRPLLAATQYPYP